ncbi:G-protein alpha subunit-domain-containing protein [Flagelloscypha sp. PMI_526]|nr:G-protein alpha subunit-domain-containing protein [Flagelloscypha sp. PMI_526]
MPAVRVPLSSSHDDFDPISNALKPPLNETEEEKRLRLEQERKEKAVSDAIDQDIEASRQATKKGPKPTNILLLVSKRASWRAVIQLNLVRNVRTLLDQISHSNDCSQLDPELVRLRLALSPILKIEESLMRRINPAMVDIYQRKSGVIQRAKELTVNSLSPWKSSLTRMKAAGQTDSFASDELVDWDSPDDPGMLLSNCAEDIQKLWTHSYVRKLLETQNIRLEEMGGFFLDSVREVTAEKYIPTDEHILRARLKTLGVTEHHFQLEKASIENFNFYLFRLMERFRRVFDVGGQSRVAAWIPYFEDVDWIIFLVPISCLRPRLYHAPIVLEEAPKINRLEDSVNLWKYIVSHKLLQNANLILFLNKIDIMRAKLESGIKLADHVVSYGDRPNDLENTSKYLKKKFSAIQNDNSPTPRTFYCHLTSVTVIKDQLFRQNLTESQLIM